MNFANRQPSCPLSHLLYITMQLQQLLKECRHKSITAQKYLFDRYSRMFFLLCRRYMKTDEQAEEAMMNGFLQIFSSLEKFIYSNDAAAIAWMQRIMVNACLQELRKKHSFLQVAEDHAADLASDDDVISTLTAAEIYKIITQLPTGYRTVFNLYVIEQMSHKEIAAILHISEGTSKSQLSKARQLLIQIWQQQNNSNDHAAAR
jgi:RNA polymerase sigma factor (sigma-70 family)